MLQGFLGHSKHFALCLLLLLLLTSCGGTAPAAATPSPQVEQAPIYQIVAGPPEDALLRRDTAAPDFRWRLPDGTERTLAGAAADGQPVLINFWASWCVPCREEMPLLQQTYLRYRERGLLVLGVNLKEDEATVVQFAGETGATFPLLRDGAARLSLGYGLMGLPMTVFVRRDGSVATIKIGPLDENMLDQALPALLTNPQ